MKVAKPATVNRERACLKHIFTLAVAEGKVSHNPVKHVKLLKEPPGRVRFLREEELGKLLEASPAYLRSIFLVAINSGMRKDEVFSLRWSQIDFRNRTITLPETKNREVGIIRMNSTLEAILRGVPRRIDTEYVFAKPSGECYEDVDSTFGRMIKRLGIEDLRFHDLRHTYAGYLAMSGCSLSSLQKLLRLKTIKMVQRYAHLSEEHLQGEVERLDQMWKDFGKVGPEEAEGQSYKLLISKGGSGTVPVCRLDFKSSVRA